MKIISDINASIKIGFNNMIKQSLMIVVENVKLQNSMRFFIERLLLPVTRVKRMPMSNLIKSVVMFIVCVAYTRV